MKRDSQKHIHTEDAIAVAPTLIRPQIRQPGEYQSGDPQSTMNQAAVELLESWRTGDEEEQRDTWEYLKHALEEDRLSDRTLLP